MEVKTPEQVMLEGLRKIEAQAKVGRSLQARWEGQAEYNALIQSVQTEHEANWGDVYLLGMMGCVDGLLDASGWKRHRTTSRKPMLRDNIARHLADMTKYLLSLWRHYGFTLTDILQVLEERETELMMELRAEFFPPSGRDVIVFDLDGTVADFRGGFAEWWGRTDNVASLHADIDNGVRYNDYENTKTAFEVQGGYERLPAYPDAIALLKAERSRGAFLFCTTARPADRFERVREDTLNWMRKHGIYPDAIVFGRDERIIQLLRLRRDNRIVMLEDDPTLAMRAVGSGIATMLRTQPYNAMLVHEHLQRFETFPERVPWERWSWLSPELGAEVVEETDR